MDQIEKQAASKAVEEIDNNEDNSDVAFSEPVEFTILSAEDASDTTKDLNIKSKKISSSKEAEELFKNTQGTKMMIVNGKLYKTNVEATENSYYRLVGEAYNSRKLNRVTLKPE